MYPKVIKRFLDVFVALIGLIITLPIILPIGFLLLWVNNGKVFFYQHRPGKNGRVFKIIKFKTMNDRQDSAGNLLPDHRRLTRVGRFVRKTSMDEIPQLWNVLRGEMSLVGPRPLLIEYLSLYNDSQKRRHEVRPGITGWAQVNGRNNLSWDEKFKLDVWYIDNLSLKLDLTILWLTINKVLKSENVNQAGQATVQYFKGNE